MDLSPFRDHSDPGEEKTGNDNALSGYFSHRTFSLEPYIKGREEGEPKLGFTSAPLGEIETWIGLEEDLEEDVEDSTEGREMVGST